MIYYHFVPQVPTNNLQDPRKIMFHQHLRFASTESHRLHDQHY